MSDNKSQRESREDALERILAETAKNPYTPKRPVRPANRPAARPVSHEKPVTQSRPHNNTQRPMTEAQKAEAAKARAARKNAENKRVSEQNEKTQQFTAPVSANVRRKPVPERKPEKRPENVDYSKSEYTDNENKKSGQISETQTITLDDILDMIESAIAVILIIVMFYTYIIRVAVVDGKSMSPTLETDDKLIVRSIGYTPEDGDVVVINNQNTHLISESGKVVEGEGLEKRIIKRVIATGGQTIDIDFESGTVTVDGRQLDETYISEPTTRDEYAFTYPLTVPEGYIFVMGDNRNVSMDSRHPEIGLVPEDDVIGKAVFRFYPFGKFGGID